MSFELMDLPYAQNALEPVISKETVNYHYGKHHQGYVDNLNKLVEGTTYEGMELEEIIRKQFSERSSSASVWNEPQHPLFNNAAQVYNHNLYWNSLTPDSEMSDEVEARIQKYYTSVDNFKEVVKRYATKHFASGWVWVCAHEDDSLFVQDTHDAGSAVVDPLVTPLLVIDIWEHAHYIDYRNDKGKYIDEIWKIVNWEQLRVLPGA